jgi:hypothetical protein
MACIVHTPPEVTTVEHWLFAGSVVYEQFDHVRSVVMSGWNETVHKE